MNNNAWLQNPVAATSESHRDAAQKRQNNLTKPPGSLGRLEQLAIDLAAIQHCDSPSASSVAIHIFAADHGVAAEGVSAFPQVVTGEMIRNFARGGAAISVLAQQLNAQLAVHNLGTVNALGANGKGVEDESLAGVTHYRIGAGSQNFCRQAAMSEEQLTRALAVGKSAAENSVASGCKLLVGGEMGIANTSSATALAASLLKLPAADIVGPGTGLDRDGVAHKCKVIEQALQQHSGYSDAIELLQRLGGFEIAALTGFYLRAAQLGTAVIIDGFICSVAALYASRINPRCLDYLFLSHKSAEPGHQVIFESLQLTPLLDLNMRLGEGSGASLACHLVRSACDLHNHMATFDQAEVSQQ